MHFKRFLSLMLAIFSSGLWAADAAHVVFSAGQVTIAGRTVQPGAAVNEGELLKTGADGYLYLKTQDNGFLILRPNSRGQIVTYRLDPQNPVAHQIKIELQEGVARHISGEAVKSARGNFRFNTPVAAIGVRGTDFTVFANSESTRVAVFSGGVIVTPFSDKCAIGGSGPCEGSSSRELFAGQTGQVLNVFRGKVPVLLNGPENSPDVVAPPRKDEPNAKSGDISSKNGAKIGGEGSLDPIRTNTIDGLVTQASTLSSAPVAKTPPLTWGRWQVLLDQAIEVDVATLQATNQLVATNSHFAVMRSNENQWRPPLQTELGFSLQQAQAVILNESTRLLSAPKVENGVLQVNFATASFSTRFDLVNQGERFVMQNRGEVSSDGKLYGGYQFLGSNNMDVRGALANDNASAAYLFQGRLDAQRVASGVTYWGR